jgi:hypothetical protein
VTVLSIDRRAVRTAPAPGFRTLVEYDREPPADWAAAIEAVAPRNDRLSWFKVVWEPGDAWQPIGRWIVWQMRPLGRHPRLLEPALLGPHPRSTGHYCGVGYCPCAVKAQHWVGGPASGVGVDRLTWELFRDTGCYGQRWWVVQGTNGGHRFKLDKVEAKLWRLATGRSDTPAAGDLPYAPLDGRVLRHVRDQDKVRLWKGAIDFAERGDAHLSAAVQEQVEQARTALLRWMENQTDLLWDEEKHRIKRVLADVPRIPGLKDTTDYEAEQAAYVTAPHADSD